MLTQVPSKMMKIERRWMGENQGRAGLSASTGADLDDDAGNTEEKRVTHCEVVSFCPDARTQARQSDGDLEG